MPNRYLKLILCIWSLSLPLSCKTADPDTPKPAETTAIKPAETPGQTPQKAGQTVTDDDIESAKRAGAAVANQMGSALIEKMTENLVKKTITTTAEAREAAKKKDHDKAITLLNELMKDRVNDTLVLQELAKVNLARGKLEVAESQALRATWRAFNPQHRSDLLFLLGQIARKQKDKKKAAAYYYESNSITDSAKSRKKLKALGGEEKVRKSGGTEPRIGAHRGIIGPANSLDQLCKTVIQAHLVPYRDTLTCKTAGGRSKGATRGPLQRAALFSLVSQKTEEHTILAIETKVGWFAVSELAYVSERINVYSSGDAYEVKRFEFADLITGGPEELIVEYTHTVQDCEPGKNEKITTSTTTQLVCGLRNNLPTCFSRMPTHHELSREVLSPLVETTLEAKIHTPGLPLKQSFSLRVDLGTAGKVIVSPSSGTLPDELSSLVGIHSL